MQNAKFKMQNAKCKLRLSEAWRERRGAGHRLSGHVMTL
jgi:hypothetical protein